MKYKLKFGIQGLGKGTILYPRNSHDYGLASDDSRLTGIPHITVTLDPKGDGPGFTVPKGYVKEIC